MEKYAVIVAGGSGTRMGLETPKQFLMLNEKTILWHSINAFINAFDDINIIVVLPNEHVETGEKIKQEFNHHKTKIFLTVGGNTRFESVKNGLQLVKNESVVFVHDAVRCLINTTLIKTCFEQTLFKGSAIPVVTAIDSLRVEENNHHKPINRNNIKIVQTPQTFLSHIILPAFQQPFNESFTDEATVVEAFGTKVFLCNGDYNNIKITRPVDLIIAEQILKSTT